MARILFCSAPLLGHLDFGGFLRTASYLKQEGHSVYWASGPEVSKVVTDAGINLLIASTMKNRPSLHSYSRTSQEEYIIHRIERSLDLWFDESRVITAAKALIDICVSLDIELIVAENCASAAGVVSESLGIPLVLCGYPYGALRQVPLWAKTSVAQNEYSRRLDKIRVQFNLAPVQREDVRWMFFISPYMHLTFFPKEWWYEKNEQIPPQARFFGGHSQTPRHDKAANQYSLRTNTCPLALLILGTLYRIESAFVRNVIRAVVEELDYDLIVAGQYCDFDELETINPHILRRIQWYRWIDYNKVMPHVDLIIHHGGIGTTHASILNGLPQLVFPQASDQFYHASRIQKQGLGLYVRKEEIDVASFTRLVEELVVLPEYRNNAASAREHFAKCGDEKAAAEYLLQVACGQILPVSNPVPELLLACNDYLASDIAN